MSSLLNYSSVLFPAIFTGAVDLECMAGGHKAVLLADLLCQVVNFGGEKLHRTATLRADHVMMATPVVLVLITGNAVVEGNLTRQPTFGQKLQRSVNGREPHSRIFFSHQPVQLVGGKMFTSLKKRAQDRIALRGMLQAHALQVPMKNLLGLPNHLA